MAALVQSYPSQLGTGTVTMLQTRPTSASGMMPMQSHQNQQYPQGSSQPRNGFHGLQSGVGGPIVYRGNTAPVQPYAFTSTPSLHQTTQWQHQGSHRAASTPTVPTLQGFDQGHNGGRSRYLASASMTNLPTTSAFGLSAGGSRDDSAIPVTGMRRVVVQTPRPQLSHMAVPSLSPTSPTQPQGTPSKASPERYRRPAARSADAMTSTQQVHAQASAPPSGSGMASVSHLYNQRGVAEQQRKQLAAMSARRISFVGTTPGYVVDDMLLNRGSSQDETKRIRRRSMPALDSTDFPIPLTPLDFSKQPVEWTRPEQSATRPKSADKEPAAVEQTLIKLDLHARTSSSDSRVSSRSNNSRPSSSAHRNTNTSSAPAGNPTSLSPVGSDHQQNSSSPDYPRLVNIPPRSSSSDAATTKRAANPSPLSNPVTMDAESEKSRPPTATAGGAVATTANQTATPPQAHKTESAAMKQLSAINEKGGKARSKTSRLRRAFSFGSAAEFRKAVGAPVEPAASTAGTTAGNRLQKDPSPEELYDAEQARIAQRQEAGGIGSSIYAGAKIFTGSTDNISISSTASSASIMIRKMGRGMKKGGRSLVGLFRPKSIVGAPTVDAQLPEVSEATVSMVTVEAERERVNVNPDPHSQTGGGTSFPRLERNSIDATANATADATANAPSTASERVGSSDTDNSTSRKSIVGGDSERAEVLAAVRKGILKRSNGSSSPSPNPVENQNRAPAFELPNTAQLTDSPSSSAPSTPNDEAQGHRRTDSIAIGNEDYFMSALRLRQDTKSAPGTPQGGTKRNATFSPRIIFYDTWPSGEYDRRGDIATCNRLTPMLAQQIKEELNSFKMEMEVHENSKIYTHFF